MRLRSKLTQYYAGPGATDPILITIPRGVYKLVVEERAVPPSDTSSSIDDETRSIQHAKSMPVGLIGAICLVFGLLLGIALTLSAGAAGKLAH